MLSSHFKNNHHSNFSLPFFLTLAVGIIFGFSFAYVWMSAITWKRMNTFSNTLGPKIYYKVDPAVADNLYNKVRVLCWVITSPKQHKTKARRIKESWGDRCNVLLFISSKEDKELPTIALNSNQLWPTTRDAFSYIHENYINSIDWVMRADDETYVIVENLRHMLQFHNPDDPVYFGRKFMKHVEHGYMSGGAGYVLSREAVKRFVKVALNDPIKCNQGIGLDDIELGHCLANVGVEAGDSRDSLGRERFFPFQPEVHMNEEYLVQIPWFFDYINASNAVARGAYIHAIVRVYGNPDYGHGYMIYDHCYDLRLVVAVVVVWNEVPDQI